MLHTGTILQIWQQYLKSVYAPTLVSVYNTINTQYRRPLTLLKCVEEQLSSKEYQVKGWNHSHYAIPQALSTWKHFIKTTIIIILLFHAHLKDHPSAECQLLHSQESSGQLGHQFCQEQTQATAGSVVPSFHLSRIRGLQPHSDGPLSEWVN